MNEIRLNKWYLLKDKKNNSDPDSLVYANLAMAGGGGGIVGSVLSSALSLVGFANPISAIAIGAGGGIALYSYLKKDIIISKIQNSSLNKTMDQKFINILSDVFYNTNYQSFSNFTHELDADSFEIFGMPYVKVHKLNKLNVLDCGINLNKKYLTKENMLEIKRELKRFKNIQKDVSFYNVHKTEVIYKFTKEQVFIQTRLTQRQENNILILK